MINVLIVDDEEDVQSLFTQRFRKEIKSDKVKFRFAFSGHAAVDTLKKEELPEIVLSDINMPGMSGLDLLKNIKSNYPSLKVIMVSAYGDQHNIDVAKNSGADDFIEKPVDFTILKERVFGFAE